MINISRHLTTGTLAFAGTLATLASFPNVATAATFIDNFSDVSGNEQAVQRGGPATTPARITILEQPGTPTGPGFTNVIGGYRDLWLQGVGGLPTPPSSTGTAVGSVSGGILSFSNGPGVQSWLNVTWDGNDSRNSSTTTSLGNRSDNSYHNLANGASNATNASRPVQRSGLGTQDLTGGGAFNSLAVQVLSADLNLAIQMRIYDTDKTRISEATYVFNQRVTKPTTIFFAFDQAAIDALPANLKPFAVLFGRDVTQGSNAITAARFTHVGAINMTLKALTEDVDARIDLLEPEDTTRFASVPESDTSTSVLAFAGLTAFATLTAKKKSDLKKQI
jgi:hypothetical protein